MPFAVTLRGVEQVNLSPDSGDDTIYLGPLGGSGVKSVVVDGGAGNDTLTDRSGRKVVVSPIGIEIVH